MFKFRNFIALVSLVLSLAGFASAQYGMPDLTGIDLNAVLAAQMQQTQGALNGVMYDAMQQRGPEIQAAYQQCLYSGSYCGSFDEYALNYVTTNGFTDGGAWAKQNQTNIANEQTAWQGVQNAEQGYRDAYGNYTGNFSQNMGEAGNVLMGNNTWTNPQTGGNYTLPYTWQPGTYNSYNGYTYYVDPSGTYYQVDPNNAGWMYQLNPWQAGQ